MTTVNLPLTELGVLKNDSYTSWTVAHDATVAQGVLGYPSEGSYLKHRAK